jgi:hypothetical protein
MHSLPQSGQDDLKKKAAQNLALVCFSKLGVDVEVAFGAILEEYKPPPEAGLLCIYFAY